MRLVAIALLAACSGPQPTPTPPPIAQADAQVAGPDVAEANQEERLAAIQKAMNELDEGAQGCWAIAATERFDIAGDVEVMVDIAKDGAKTQVMRDTTKNSRLLACLSDVLQKYQWAPPLYGQAIQLPFKFKAPDSQNTIDRRLVAWNGQGKVSVAVLIDFNNTNTANASMLEVAIQAGGGTGMRVPERTELWYFLDPATVNNKPVEAGDMVYVPTDAGRDVQAKAGDVHAMVALLPGGREGTARAGALPALELDGKPKKQPVILPAAKAKTFGPAQIFVEPATVKGTTFAASVIRLPAGMTVAEHVHAQEAELLYLLSGSGSMTIAGGKLPVTSTTVVQIPAGTKHSFTAAEDVRAVQIYTPAGPEQRFKTRPK
jgi:quercetin dioxygenase-like cupin family protein